MTVTSEQSQPLPPTMEADQEQTMGEGRSPAPSPAPSISGDSTDSTKDFKPTTRFYLAFLALAVLTLMVALDGTSISVALPIIARTLHGTAIEAFWAGTSFLLTSTVYGKPFHVAHIPLTTPQIST